MPRIASSETLGKHGRALERLRIEEMKASRQQDVAMILRKIQNLGS